MAVWRALASCVIILAATASGSAQTYPLVEVPQVGDCFQYQLEMNLAGEMHLIKDDRPLAMKLSAVAAHVFPERVLVVSSKGMPQKAARVYEKASAKILAGSAQSDRGLRPDRCLMVVQRPKDQTLIYCPKGAVTREEMELTSDHFDTLALTGLLPGKPVQMKETWKVGNEVAQALCHFEGVTSQELTCTLDEVKGDDARVSVSGSVAGIDVGAMVKMTVLATYHYDLKTKHLMSLEWKQKDDRGQGPVSPASVVETVYTLKRTPIAQPEQLSDVALIAVPADFEPPVNLTQLAYQDAKGRFQMLYARDWQIVNQSSDRVVMRLMERGDFVAQATITPWTKMQPGQHLTPEEFQKAMADTPGWKQTQVLQSGVVPVSDTGRWIYRISALGEMDGMSLLHNFYLIAGPNGDQVVVVFAMVQAQTEKLGSRDLSLVGSVELPDVKK